jgi:hypothetical protein
MIGELMWSFGIRSREGTERARGFAGAGVLLDTVGAGDHTFVVGFFPPHPVAVAASSAPAATPMT